MMGSEGKVRREARGNEYREERMSYKGKCV